MCTWPQSSALAIDHAQHCHLLADRLVVALFSLAHTIVHLRQKESYVKETSTHLILPSLIASVHGYRLAILLYQCNIRHAKLLNRVLF